MLFAPYVDTTLYPPFKIQDVPNANIFTLGFVIADESAEPSWGGYYPTVSGYYNENIEAVRVNGGDVIVSFGGADGAELATVTNSVAELVEKYDSVIKKYNFTSLDFDIEGPGLSNWAANKRRAEAIKTLTMIYPDIHVSLTVPTEPDGLTNDVLRLIKMTPCNLVNIMAMDYGNGQNKMAEFAMKAAKAARKQTGKMIGITPMIGQNDIEGEIFTLSDAHRIKNFARTTVWVKRLSMWSINRDTGIKGPLETSSQVDQFPYQYSHIFNGC